MKRILFGAWWVALVGVQPLPVAAQPPASTVVTGPTDVATIGREWKSLQTQVGMQEVTDAPSAIARYTAFYETRGRHSGQVSIEISSRIAQLYVQGLGNRQKALEIYAWAIQ